MFTDYVSVFRMLFIEQIDGVYFSDIILIVLIAALITIVPGYIKHVKSGLPVKRIVLNFDTAAYLGLILMLTIFRREPGSKSGTIYTHLNFGITKAGVYSMRQVIYSLMNVILFVPWGVLMGLYRKKQNPVRTIIMVTIIGFMTSFLIEFLQIATRRGFFEVTDLATNVTGAFLGAFCVAIGVKVTERMKKNGI